MKAIITFKDDNGFVLTNSEAKRILSKELERLESACPRHRKFNNTCGVCARMSNWTLHRKVEFLIDLLLR